MLREAHQEVQQRRKESGVSLQQVWSLNRADEMREADGRGCDNPTNDFRIVIVNSKWGQAYARIKGSCVCSSSPESLAK